MLKNKVESSIHKNRHKDRIENFPLNQIIREAIRNKGIKLSWISQQIQMPYSTLTGKLEKNTFTAIELLEIAAVVNLDLNEWCSLTKEYKKKIS